LSNIFAKTQEHFYIYRWQKYLKLVHYNQYFLIILSIWCQTIFTIVQLHKIDFTNNMSPMRSNLIASLFRVFKSHTSSITHDCHIIIYLESDWFDEFGGLIFHTYITFYWIRKLFYINLIPYLYSTSKNMVSY